MLTNSDDEKVRYKIDVYILHMVLLVTISQFMIANICYHYAKYRSKQKNTGTLAIKKWKKIAMKFLIV